MGRTHTLTGLAAGAVTLPALPAGAGVVDQVGWVLAVGGMTMLPDLDHPQATIARMWGPVTVATARGVAWVAGGHRNGTHDLLIAPLVFGLLAWAGLLTTVGTVVVVAVTAGLALRAASIAIPGDLEEHPLINAALSFGSAWWVVASGYAVPEWLPYAVVLGVLVHIAGDAITHGGAPVLLTWLTSRPRRFPGGPIGTGGLIEQAVIAPALLLATGWLIAVHTPIAGALTTLGR